MSGRNKFRELARPIDEDPVRRERVEELGRAYEALLDLVGYCGSEEERRDFDRRTEEMSIEELRRFGEH